MSRRLLISVIVIAVLGVFIAWQVGAFTPSPLAALTADWNTLSKSSKLNATASNRGALAQNLDAFAGEIGSLALPSYDETDAHKLIAAAIAVADDEQSTTFIAPSSTTTTQPSSVCVNDPSSLNCVLSKAPVLGVGDSGIQTPASYSGDVAALNRDFRTLYADLGGKG